MAVNSSIEAVMSQFTVPTAIGFLAGSLILLIVLLLLLVFVAWIWMIVDCVKRKTFRNADRVGFDEKGLVGTFVGTHVNHAI